jgi:hypothetical protein
MRAAFQRLLGDGYYVQVPGMVHTDLTDIPRLSPLASGWISADRSASSGRTASSTRTRWRSSTAT